MPPRDPDDLLVVIFKHLPLQNEAKTLDAGRPIFDDVEVCEIRAPGAKDFKVFPATAVSHWQDDPFTGTQSKISYAERFSHQYRQFKARSQQTTTGTPLDYALFLSEGKRAELRALNVYTIEALAAIDGVELKNLGPGGRDLKNRAMEYIEEGKQSAPNKQMAAELEALRARNSVLEDDLVALRSNRQRAEAELEAMSDEQLRDYIASNTGRPPQGNVSRKTLKHMAMSVMNSAPEKAA